ncbi:MAG: SAM-dependent methyltransferase [Firmicutes bacterium]|nr:SAM-dependent methyltransferase [Bacillota bacterium]
MQLSDRLEKIISLIDRGNRLLDVGCDHGYLAIEAIRRGIVPEAICSDVRRGPLDRAKAHVAEAGLADKIRLRLTDGLNGLAPDEAETLVIAGMGGMLMMSILEKAFQDPGNGIYELRQMVLEPQSDLPSFREMIDRTSFRIKDEFLVLDRGKYYFIFDLCPRGKKEAVRQDPIFSFPLLDRRDLVYRDYLEKEYQKNEDIIRKLTDESTVTAIKRCQALKEENEKIREVISKCYR